MAEALARLRQEEVLAEAAHRRLLRQARLASRIAEGRRRRALAHTERRPLGVRVAVQIYSVRARLAAALRALAARLEAPETHADDARLAPLPALRGLR